MNAPKARKIKEKTALPRLIAVVGPTASGKTDLALALAKRFKGEIISADSRQFYRGTEIGSDIVPGKWVRKYGRRTYIAKGVPHYLVGFLSPARTFTAAQFKDHVIRISRDIAKRGHLPILVGGTGLFVSIVVDNLEMPEVPPNPAFRARMERVSTARLYAMLQKKDPAYAARIPAGNRRYAVRALEVMQALGKPFSEAQGRGEPLFRALQIGVTRDREESNRRIDSRVDAMMKHGLLEEAQKLGKRHGWTVPAMTGLGHRQLGTYLRGETTLEEAVQSVKTDTKRYAKRQRTWFRRDKRILWVKNEKEAEKAIRAFLRTC